MKGKFNVCGTQRILRTPEIISVKLASARMTPSSVKQILVSVTHQRTSLEIKKHVNCKFSQTPLINHTLARVTVGKNMRFCWKRWHECVLK